MKYVVLGAGMMGRAVAYDLATYQASDDIVLADINLEAATSAARSIGERVHPVRLNVDNDAALAGVLEGASAVVSAVSYAVNVRITEAAIRAGAHMCDLGGNNDVVDRQLTLDGEARRRDVAIIPNCGLAPGLINILGMSGASLFQQLDSIRLRVGGLPQHPRPPLMYEIVFSVEGLINEYIEPSEVIRDARRLRVRSMEDLEEIEFPPPFGRMEAFTTSGGLALMARSLERKVRELDYKTIRYPGHCEKFRTLLELGFASSEPLTIGSGLTTARELFTELLRRKLQGTDTDLVLARATVTGQLDGRRRRLEYEFIDYYDAKARMTSMARTTAFPTAIIAAMLVRGEITTRGVASAEQCVDGEAMIRELARRGIQITRRLTDAEAE